MTSAPAIEAGWVGLIVFAAIVHRPRGMRLPYAQPIRPVVRVGSTLGAWLRRLARRPADAESDVRVGQMVVGMIGGTLIDLRLGVAAAVAAGVAPVLRQRSRNRDFEAAVVRELPEVIDLLRLALSGQGSILNATTSVGRLPLGPVSTALAKVNPAVRGGQRLSDVLTRMGEELGEHTRGLVRSLVGSELYGTELGPTLDRLAEEARETRRRRAQTEARRVPIRMLMPLVLGILPAFVLLTVVPTLINTFSGLDL